MHCKNFCSIWKQLVQAEALIFLDCWCPKPCFMLRNTHEGQQFDVSLKRQIISDGPKVKYNTGGCVTSCISGIPMQMLDFSPVMCQLQEWEFSLVENHIVPESIFLLLPLRWQSWQWDNYWRIKSSWASQPRKSNLSEQLAPAGLRPHITSGNEGAWKLLRI